MVAPFWVDNDARYGHVFYHIYDATDDDNMERTREILKLAEKDAIEHGGVSEVDPSWVLIVTWTDMVPRLWYNAHADHVCIIVFIIGHSTRHCGRNGMLRCVIDHIGGEPGRLCVGHGAGSVRRVLFLRKPFIVMNAGLWFTYTSDHNFLSYDLKQHQQNIPLFKNVVLQKL